MAQSRKKSSSKKGTLARKRASSKKVNRKNLKKARGGVRADFCSLGF